MIYKDTKVVMLSTEKASGLGKLDNDLYYLDGDKCSNYQHLYLLSDEEIKKGDWFYSVRGLVEPAVINYPKGEHIGKIIATTDSSIMIFKGNDLVFYPQIPQSFLPIYVKAYNDGTPIDKVEVEYEEVITELNITSNDIHYPITKNLTLKLTDNNEVIIKVEEADKTFTQDEVTTMFGEWGILQHQQRIKGEFTIPCCDFLNDRFGIRCNHIPKMYTKEEVENKIEEYREFVWKNGATLHDKDKWVKENLK